MPEPGMGNKSEQDGYGRDVGSRDDREGQEYGPGGYGPVGGKAPSSYTGGTPGYGYGPSFSDKEASAFAGAMGPVGLVGYGLAQAGRHMATPNPDGSYGFTDPNGYSRQDGGDRMSRFGGGRSLTPGPELARLLEQYPWLADKLGGMFGPGVPGAQPAFGGPGASPVSTYNPPPAVAPGTTPLSTPGAYDMTGPKDIYGRGSY